MKVVHINAFGGPEQLVLTEVSPAVAHPGQVIVNVEASGVGLVDSLLRRGMYPGLEKPGLVPGSEVAGQVVSLGDGVDEAWLGQRVYALVRTGGYAQEISVATTDLIVLPDFITSVQAVGLGINALVATLALKKANLQRGQHLLIRGAGGGIGVMATQLALQGGAVVTAVTSSELRRKQLQAYGSIRVLNRSEAATGTEPYDGIIDPVAGPESALFLSKLRPNGHYVFVGLAAGLPPMDWGMSLLQIYAKSPSVSFLSLDSSPAHVWQAALTDAFTLVLQGKLKAVVQQTYPLAEAAQAHHQLDSGEVFGKLVLTSQ
ncbi:quinone oxidoreductase family protein [Siphonobacter sp.]|uniref:quinone oxidoreductase family protein n=1 Tax=Siphonobacter sp. TaxID=1869184 RepID=UPI003B3B7ABD